MVDGIVDLSSERIDMRSMRYLTIVKLRGAPFLEGRHSYVITSEGVVVYPRTEARFVDIEIDLGKTPSQQRLATGIPRFDATLGGGIVAQSTTLLLGSSGAGKSIMGLQFLAEGARRGEKCLHFGCYEPPATVIAKADRLGLDFSGQTKNGNVFIHWFRPAEVLIDALVIDLLEIIREKKIERLFIDGFVGFRSTHPPDRVSAVFSALTARLIASGVTTLITDETRELFVREVEVPTGNVSAIFHNIVFLRQVEVGAELLRLISVMKTRDSAPDRRLWHYEIGDGGVELLEPFTSADNRLMTGGGNNPKPARGKDG
jgi:circadian clock protein KaiC